MKSITLKKGEYIRIKGKVTMYAPYKKVDGRWIGGSSWTEKNPLIRIGECKHKLKKVYWIKNTDLFGKYIKGEKKRIYFKKGKERVICSDCGNIIKLGELTSEN